MGVAEAGGVVVAAAVGAGRSVAEGGGVALYKSEE